MRTAEGLEVDGDEDGSFRCGGGVFGSTLDGESGIP